MGSAVRSSRWSRHFADKPSTQRGIQALRVMAADHILSRREEFMPFLTAHNGEPMTTGRTHP